MNLERECPSCGSLNWARKGLENTPFGKVQWFHCWDCEIVWPEVLEDFSFEIPAPRECPNCGSVVMGGEFGEVRGFSLYLCPSCGLIWGGPYD